MTGCTTTESSSKVEGAIESAHRVDVNPDSLTILASKDRIVIMNRLDLTPAMMKRPLPPTRGPAL
jgi:hypothetical protein